MKTLYIDVYFLINFTVDILALYFSALFAKVPTGIRRLVLSAIFGAAFAVLTVFLPDNVLVKIISSSVSLVIVAIIAVKRVSLRRRGKFILSFFIFEALIGGGVSFLFGIFDRYLQDFLASSGGGVVNRKLLLLSLVVLLSIGVFKMLVSFFSNIESEGSVEMEIEFLGRRICAEAFVDSGNLAIDPMDMRPVVLLKRDMAKNLLPREVIDLKDPDLLDREVRRRIRLIPISQGGVTRVLTGVRADSVRIVKDGKREEISATIAIDREGGDYGGFFILMPAAVMENVVG